MIHVLCGIEQYDMRLHRTIQNGMIFKTYELFTYVIFHLLFLDHDWLQVTAIVIIKNHRYRRTSVDPIWIRWVGSVFQGKGLTLWNQEDGTFESLLTNGKNNYLGVNVKLEYYKFKVTSLEHNRHSINLYSLFSFSPHWYDLKI